MRGYYNNCKLKFLYLIYSCSLGLALPVLFMRLWHRARLVPLYKRRWLERLGIFNCPVQYQHGIWIHTVSLGETIAATGFIRQLQATYKTTPLIITTTTPTGSLQVTKTFGDSVFHVYLPYDLAWTVKNFLGRTKPKFGIIFETELWPNLLRIAKLSQLPVLLANGRLSHQSLTGYRKIQALAKNMLDNLSGVAAQSAADGERYVKLGLAPDKLVIMGNTKYDIQPSAKHLAAGKKLKQAIGERPVWIAASTHRGEEEQILAVHKKILLEFPNCLLVLVPRHPERAQAVAELILAHNMRFVQRSLQQLPDNKVQVLLGDTTGELIALYRAADLVFVGGSLVPVGGHNILEPASIGLPVVVGPHLHNFADIRDKLIAANGLVIVNDGAALYTQVTQLLANPCNRAELGANGRLVIDQNQGAVQKLLEIVKSHYDHYAEMRS